MQQTSRFMAPKSLLTKGGRSPPRLPSLRSVSRPSPPTGGRVMCGPSYQDNQPLRCVHAVAQAGRDEDRRIEFTGPSVQQLDLAVEALDQRDSLRIELLPIEGTNLDEVGVGFRDRA